MSINNIQTACHSPQHHPHHLHREAELWGKPPVPVTDADGTCPKPIEPRATQHQLRYHEQQPKFGFIHSVVLPNHPPSTPIRQSAGEQEPKHGADQRAGVHVPGLDFGKPERRAEEDGSEHDADHHGPADQGTLGEHGPEHGGMDEERQGPQQERDERGPGQTGREERERLEIAPLFCRTGRGGGAW